MQTPQWAQDLIIDATLYLQNNGYPEITLPDVKWRKPTTRIWDLVTDKARKVSRRDSSGVCYKTHITICAGHDRKDCKLVILHELAHWARPWGEHHSSAFWDLAWQLFREYKLPVLYCKQREQNYRKGALAAYRRNKNK